jgi:hypothetical protein
LKLLSFDLLPLVAAIAVAVPLGFLLWSPVAWRNRIPLIRYCDAMWMRGFGARKRRQEEAAAEDTDDESL